MKFNSKCVKNMYKLFAVSLMFLVVMSCNRESAYSELLTDDYPELYTYIFERNSDSLLTFTDNPDTYINEQAWRGLINTPVNDIDDLITRVQYSNSRVAWSALSTKDLTDDQLSRLHDLWNTRYSMRNGISLVLGKQGNQASLDFLVRNFENFMDSDHEYETALAISRLMMEFEMRESSKKSLFRYSAIKNDPEIFRAYFYGYYRGSLELTDAEMIQTLWETYEWTDEPTIKQYVAKILFNSDADWFFERLQVQELSSYDIQIAIELAQHSGQISWDEKLGKFYEQLLGHQNPMVNEVALQQIIGRDDKPNSFDEVITSRIIENEDKEATVRLSGIVAISEKEKFVDLVKELSEENEFVLIKKFSIYKEVFEEEELLDLFQQYAAVENPMKAAIAISQLSAWWSDSGKSEDLRNRVRNIALEALSQNKMSVTVGALNLINSADLIEERDFERFKNLTNNYSTQAQTEVFSAVSNLMMEHFEERSESFINTLEEEGNPHLNYMLNQQGWDVEEVQKTELFHKPNWQRLGELDYEPIWVLETEKGNIKVKVDVLAAPITISAIDSLTRAGEYDGVGFHRVVPNFVIQGGDIKTAMGFGSAGFIVPTEASETEYKRGVAGMARSDIDTEGSQYFMMHQWKPHLNEGYTIIGKVIEGMETVDRIMPGDKVLKAYWQPRD